MDQNNRVNSQTINSGFVSMKTGSFKINFCKTTCMKKKKCVC